VTPQARDYSRLVMAAEPTPFWLDGPGSPPVRDSPPVRERLRGSAACDLAVIGGGFTGLWTALLAKDRRSLWLRTLDTTGLGFDS
jgi:hypothetical protein